VVNIQIAGLVMSVLSVATSAVMIVQNHIHHKASGEKPEDDQSDKD
jgi:hypothetical protein